jgi:hypothetical protein
MFRRDFLHFQPKGMNIKNSKKKGLGPLPSVAVVLHYIRLQEFYFTRTERRCHKYQVHTGTILTSFFVTK